MKFSDTPAFTPTRLEEERKEDKGKVITIRLNEKELGNLAKIQNILQQEKESTTVKQVFSYGMFVLQERSTAHILRVLYDNLRKNKRLGIEFVDVKPPKKEHL